MALGADARREDNASLRFAALGLGAAVIVGGGILGVHYLNQGARVAEALAWGASGAPCQEVTAEAFAAQPVQVRKTMTFEGLRIGRAIGAADCSDITDRDGKGWDKHPACRFPNPAALEVHAAGQSHYYLTGFGNNAVVALERGKVSCKVGPNDAFGLRSGRRDSYP